MSFDPTAAKPQRTVRLKLPSGWTVLPPGMYEIGRSQTCHVLLDGAKVSRIHARLHVEIDGATFEDMGSSNGSYVNGERLSRAKRVLADSDVIVIGEFDLPVRIGAGQDEAEREAPSIRPTLVDTELPAHKSPETLATTKTSRFDLLGAVAERAIAVGDSARAESILNPGLNDFLDGARKGHRIEPALRNDAIRLALVLARALSAPAWFDYAVALLAASKVLPNEKQARDLEQTLSGLTGTDVRKLSAYADMVRDLPASIEKMRALRHVETMVETAMKRR